MVNSIRLSPPNQIHFFRVQHATVEIVQYAHKLRQRPHRHGAHQMEKDHSKDVPQPE